jgi:hypothetical protein
MGKKAKTPSGKRKAQGRKLPKSELPPPPKPLETEVCLHEANEENGILDTPLDFLFFKRPFIRKIPLVLLLKAFFRTF